MKKIMIFPGGYFPGRKYGGILTSKMNFVEQFGEDYEIFVVAYNHDYRDKAIYPSIKKGWNTVGKGKVLYISDSDVKESFIDSIVDSIRPDLIYAAGTITSYFSLNRYVIKVSRKHNIPILISADGDLCTNALRIKFLKKVTAIVLIRIIKAFRLVWFQATSAEEYINLQKYLGINKSRIFEVTNVPGVQKIISSIEKKSNSLKVLFISRVCKKKNLVDAINIVAKAKGCVSLDIYGPIEDKNYWDNCTKLIERLNCKKQITYKGELSPEQARAVFQHYECLLLPTYSENYGYVIEEALVCGCPVIISKSVTPWDDIDGKAGFTSELGDLDDFVDKVNKLAKLDKEGYDELRRSTLSYINNRLQLDLIKNQYSNMFKSIIEE